MYCIYCGNKLESNQKFCGHCGNPNINYKEIEQKSDEVLDNVDLDTQENSNPVIDEEPYSENNDQIVVQAENETYVEPTKWSVCALIFSAFGGIAGIMFVIFGLMRYKERKNRILLFISAGLIIVWLCVLAALIYHIHK